jgi:hypothetical protein
MSGVEIAHISFTPRLSLGAVACYRFWCWGEP